MSRESFEDVTAGLNTKSDQIRALARAGYLRTEIQAVEFATLEWVDWFNNRRHLEPIGNILSDEAE